VAVLLLVAELQMPDDKLVLERGMLGEAAHPLEADPRLVPWGGTERH
jgi:hypothetical protein